MLKATTALVLVLTVCPSLTSQARVATAAGPEQVSMLQLIANPEAFDGKSVAVIGYLQLEFEGNVLYVHAEDYQHRILKNGLWVQWNRQLDESIKKLNFRYVLIAGTFNAKNRGHRSLNAGALEQITRIIAWPPQITKTAPSPTEHPVN